MLRQFWFLLLGIALAACVSPAKPVPVPSGSSDIPAAISNPDTVLTTDLLVFPNGFMQSIKEYGAKGDGVTDDTAAIQRALDDGRRNPDGSPIYEPPDALNGRSKALYFPKGKYVVSDTLDWYGCCVTFQGQGPNQTIIQLKSSSLGFNDPQNPKPVIRAQPGNMSFRQNFYDLGIHVAANNAGAVGLEYVANNHGAVRNVRILSEDGKGAIGLGQTQAWSGPCMIKNLEVIGFDYGIRVQYIEYSQTYENIVLRNQNIAGIRNDGAVLAIRGLYSQNSVPVFANNGYGHGLIALLDGQFVGSNSSVSAIQTRSSGNNPAYMYLRNVSATGYQSLLEDNGVVMAGSSVTEWFSHPQQTLGFTANPKAEMLKLPSKNTPVFHDTNLDNWGAVNCYGYGACQVASVLQDLLNSGKTTIYFPFGNRLVYNELTVTVPSSVRRIIGFGSAINTDSNGINGGGIRFVVEGNSSQPLLIEEFGYGIKVEHRGSRTVAIKNSFVYEYTPKAGAGDLILEDVELHGFRVITGQHVWAKQLNNENRRGTKVINDGATLWILGWKTEGQHTVIDTRNGISEYIGGLLYPATNDLQAGEIAFINTNSKSSFLYSNIVYTTRNYDTQILQDGKQIQTKDVPQRTRLFVSP